MIRIEKLSKSFGSKVVFKDISLEFSVGNVYGIVGENGAGKTTLFRCLAGLEAYEGKIYTSQKPLKNHLGFLTAEPFFMTKITGKEFIRLLCNARGIKNIDIESKNIFDLPLNQYASTYSTGMKKKLAITAILLQQNEFFILDEPFNGVDIQSNIILTEIILKLKELKKTVLISSHIFSTLADTCDEIHLLGEGIIKKSVKKPEFRQLEEEMKKVIVGDSIDRLGLS
jgi:ABC-2 type transport system ATP-binding protein